MSRGNIVRGTLAYLRDYRRYRTLPQDQRFPLRLLDTYPILYDRYRESGELPRHYFHQDLWAARKVHYSGVATHYDFGSRIDGFVAHCLSFCDVVLFDIRPLTAPPTGLRFVEADVTDLSAIPSDSIPSLSSLHAIEHIGLGRYGDRLDPQGYLQAIRELQRVTEIDGSLYVSVPIGRERLEFNGQRIFDPRYFASCFDRCDLVEFSAIDDDDRLWGNADLETFVRARNACGLFHFRKRA